MFISYPSGFRSPIGLANKGPIQPDPELVKFLDDLRAHRCHQESWATRDRFYTIARRLFGDFGAWLDLQEINPEISQTAYDMIADTIDFINKGRRSVMSTSRMAVIKTEVQMKTYYRNIATRRTTTLRARANFRLDDYIFYWANQPDGFADMLCIVSFIFGTDLRK